MLPKQKRMSLKLPPSLFCTKWHHSNAETSRHRSYLNRCWQCPCGYREEAARQTNILACRVHTSHYFCEATPKTVYCQDRWPCVLSWFFWDPAVQEHVTRHSGRRSTGRRPWGALRNTHGGLISYKLVHSEECPTDRQGAAVEYDDH